MRVFLFKIYLYDMDNLIKKILLEELGKSALNKMEINMFRHLNSNKKNLSTKAKMIDFIKTMMPIFSRPESDALYYYELYTANYRPEGDYENITSDNIVNFINFKQRKISNINGYIYVTAKIPFKGSNVEGYWETNDMNKWIYIVKSYGWYPIFTFIDNVWYEVNDSYSSSTSKQMRNVRPNHYNSDLDTETVQVSQKDIRKLIDGKAISDVESERINDFLEHPKLGDIKKLTLKKINDWENNKSYNVKFSVNDIKQNERNIEIDVNIISVKDLGDKKSYKFNELDEMVKEKIIKGLKNTIVSTAPDFLNSKNSIINIQ